MRRGEGRRVPPAERPPGEDRRFYGRRQGRRLRPRRRLLVENLLPRLAFTPPAKGPFDPAALFDPRPSEVWLEIGFGGGEHLVWQAERHPDIGMLGADPYLDGVAKLLVRLDEAGVTNIRLLPDDVRDLIDVLAPACLGRVFLLFPDPWPKRRHHRRRIVQPGLLDGLARAMRPGAELRLATDDAGYKCWMLRHLLAHPAFAWLARAEEDWRERPADWPPTRYEEKAVGRGAECLYLRFSRRDAERAPHAQI